MFSFPELGQKFEAVIDGVERTCSCVVMSESVSFIYKVNGKYAKKVMTKAAAKKVIK